MKKIKVGDVYQLVVLLAIIGIIAMTYMTSGQVNEMALGALVGVMVGIGAPVKSESE